MITLSQDDKLIRVENWEDIVTRPRFSSDLDPKQHQLDSIIGRYAFKDEIRCGLSECHAWHGKGYIVLTRDYRETNIGKDCGKKYFGVDFETMSKKFERDVAAAENRERLWSFSFRTEDVEKEIEDLRRREHGADWTYKKLQALTTLHLGCPEKVVRAVAQLVKARSGLLTQSRLANEDETQQLEEREGRKLQRPHYLDEYAGEIAGLEALFPENDLKQILVIELGEPFKEFRALDIDSLQERELRKWARWVDNVEPLRERADQAMHASEHLLRRNNLAQLVYLLNSDEAAKFNSWLRSLERSA